MIQIGCLLVGQTLNITIRSLARSVCLTVLFAACVCVSRVVNGIVNSIIKQKNYTQQVTAAAREEKKT